MPNLYDENFFDARRDGSLASARRVVPIVAEMTRCRSVIDVGCGLGTWLAAFREQGIEDFRGIDGDYVNKDRLLIPREAFLTADLSQPLKADRHFDLAVSLEVAEHLPPAVSELFVKLLTSYSPVVLFSGSLPYQDGTGHINEHWLEYWVELFRQRGYRAVDCLRPMFWNDSDVDWWYAQNMMLYVSERHLADYPRIEALARTTLPPLTYVHPKFLIYKENRLQGGLRVKELWKTAFQRTGRAIIRRLINRGPIVK